MTLRHAWKWTLAAGCTALLAGCGPFGPRSGIQASSPIATNSQFAARKAVGNRAAPRAEPSLWSQMSPAALAERFTPEPSASQHASLGSGRQLPQVDEKQGAIALARLSERNGQGDQALKIYNEILRFDPNDVTTHHRLGVIYAKDQKYEQSEAHFRRAHDLGPPSAELLGDIGYMYFMQHRLGEAERFLRRAIEQDPRNESICNNLGLVLGEQERFEESLAMFRRAGSDAAAHANLGYIFTQLGRLDEAQELYRHALNLDKNLRPAAAAMLQVAQRQRAEKSFRSPLEAIARRDQPGPQGPPIGQHQPYATPQPQQLAQQQPYRGEQFEVLPDTRAVAPSRYPVFDAPGASATAQLEPRSSNPAAAAPVVADGQSDEVVAPMAEVIELPARDRPRQRTAYADTPGKATADAPEQRTGPPAAQPNIAATGSPAGSTFPSPFVMFRRASDDVDETPATSATFEQPQTGRDELDRRTNIQPRTSSVAETRPASVTAPSRQSSNQINVESTSQASPRHGEAAPADSLASQRATPTNTATKGQLPRIVRGPVSTAQATAQPKAEPKAEPKPTKSTNEPANPVAVVRPQRIWQPQPAEPKSSIAVRREQALAGQTAGQPLRIVADSGNEDSNRFAARPAAEPVLPKTTMIWQNETDSETPAGAAAVVRIGDVRENPAPVFKGPPRDISADFLARQSDAAKATATEASSSPTVGAPAKSQLTPVQTSPAKASSETGRNIPLDFLSQSRDATKSADVRQQALASLTAHRTSTTQLYPTATTTWRSADIVPAVAHQSSNPQQGPTTTTVAPPPPPRVNSGASWPEANWR